MLRKYFFYVNIFHNFIINNDKRRFDMKTIGLFVVAFFSFLTIQAQEELMKDTYIKNGNVIEATLYFDNGVISQKGFFTNDGKLTGKWISYNREGNKTAEAQYNAGKKVGTWFFWSNDKLTEVNYNNSSIAAVHTWKDKDTRIVSTNR